MDSPKSAQKQKEIFWPGDIPIKLNVNKKPDPKISPHQTEVIVWHQSKHWTVTLPEINSLPLEFYHPKKQLEFEPSKWQYMCIVWSLQDGWFNDPSQFTTVCEWWDISDLSSSGIRMLWSLQNVWQNGALNVCHTSGVFNYLERDSLIGTVFATLWREWNENDQNHFEPPKLNMLDWLSL